VNTEGTRRGSDKEKGGRSRSGWTESCHAADLLEVEGPNQSCSEGGDDAGGDWEEERKKD
jgi:hypothetical protein